MGSSYEGMPFDEPVNVENHGYEVFTQDSYGNKGWELIKNIVLKLRCF
jgi:hypothetical protein